MNKGKQRSQIKKYYDRRYLHGGAFRSSVKRYEQFLKPLDLKEGRKLLDIGCGEGHVLQIAQEKRVSCWGIDISEEAVKLSRKKVKGALCRVMVADGEELPFADAFFDYVTSIGSLEHFLNPDKGIREIVRVCRDDGKICIVVPNSFGFLHRLGVYKGTGQIQEKLATLSEWRNFLEQNGVRIVRVSRDRGPDVFKDVKPHKIIQRLLLRLTMFLPLCMAYQFVFVCDIQRDFSMARPTSKFRRGCWALVTRALSKKIIGPLKYGKGNDYDARRYWKDRFSKYGHSLKGVGHEGLSEAENKRMYTESAEVFTNLCREERIDFRSTNALEIGVGNGFYTQILHGLAIKSYVGVDITDVLFPELRKKFPHFRFVRKDICSEKIDEEFNLIVMIDVVQHIVTEDKLSFCMENVRNCLGNNGIFIVAPITRKRKRSLFYVRSWASEDIQRRFPGYVLREPVPFRSGYILTIRKLKT